MDSLDVGMGTCEVCHGRPSVVNASGVQMCLSCYAHDNGISEPDARRHISSVGIMPTNVSQPRGTTITF